MIAVVLVAACQSGTPAPSGGYAGTCTVVAGGGNLIFAPARGDPGPAFLFQPARGPGDYDAQVNAVDAQGRYGPDARGTVHLDASRRSGTLSTPDLHTAAGDTVRYGGAWHCATVQSTSPVPEPTGGPASPR